MTLYKFEIHSTLSVPEVLERIGALAREQPGFFQSLKESFQLTAHGTPPFIGRVEGSEFTFRRDIRYRNSWLPRIRGTIVAGVHGSVVRVTMGMYPFVAVFTAAWLGMVAVGFVATLRDVHGDVHGPLLTAAMFTFGLGLVVVCFYPEARKARRILEECIGVSPNNALQPTRASGRAAERSRD